MASTLRVVAPISPPRIGAICFLFFSVSCASYTSLKEDTFNDQPSAGSVHVAAQSIAPFDEYIDSLQPRFDITAAQALDQAIVVTSVREVEELKALAATLNVALTQLQTVTGGGQTRVPGDTGSLSAPPVAPLPTVAPYALPGVDSLQTDPTLRYHAAASLFQEVSLLSNYVRDAAVNRGQVPYILRLLITSHPNSRTSPYDFSATVAFFEDADWDSSFAVHGYKTWNAWKDGINSSTAGEKIARNLEVAKIAKDLLARPCGDEPLSVIPLFATESYEASLLSSVFATSQSLGLSVGGSVGAVGVGAGGQKTAQEQQRALIRSLNQPFSVARIAENTLQVRLAAVFAGTQGGFVSPARTYNLTTLVLARRTEPPSDYLEVVPCPIVRFRAETEARQVGHAASLGRPPLTPVVEAHLREELKASFPHGAALDAAIRQLSPTLVDQNYQEFLKRAKGLELGSGARDSTWVTAQEVMAAWGMSVGRLRVPDRLFSFFTTGSEATLIDDGSSAVLKVMDWYTYVPANGLSVRLTVDDAAFPAEKVGISADGQTVTVAFPSTKKACAPAVSDSGLRCALSAELSWRKPVFRWGNLTDSRFESKYVSGGAGRKVLSTGQKEEIGHLSVRYTDPEKPPYLPKPQLAVPAGRVVVVPPDIAIVSVIIRPARPDPKKPALLLPLALSVSGAEVVRIAGDGVVPTSRFWKVSSDTTLTLQLRNVIAGGTVRIQASTLKPDNEIDEGASAFQDLIAVAPPFLPEPKKEREN
jgi:hypothetical protein